MSSSSLRRSGRRAIPDAPLDQRARQRRDPRRAPWPPAALSATPRRPCASPATLSASSCAPTLRLREALSSIREETLDLAGVAVVEGHQERRRRVDTFLLEDCRRSVAAMASAWPSRRRRHDRLSTRQEMRRRLRELSQDELLELEAAVAAREARARVELAAIDFEASRRRLNREIPASSNQK